MTDVTADIDAMIARARKAQQSYEANGSQERFDRAAEAAAWALMEPSRNAELAAFAVAETGLGKIADKITKNHRKTLGLLRDIHGKTSFGLIDDDAQSGVSEFLRPKGVVAAIVPSTNPLATPINNVVNALKTGNAIILAPSPKVPRLWLNCWNMSMPNLTESVLTMILCRWCRIRHQRKKPHG